MFLKRFKVCKRNVISYSFVELVVLTNVFKVSLRREYGDNCIYRIKASIFQSILGICCLNDRLWCGTTECEITAEYGVLSTAADYWERDIIVNIHLYLKKIKRWLAIIIIRSCVNKTSILFTLKFPRSNEVARASSVLIKCVVRERADRAAELSCVYVAQARPYWKHLHIYVRIGTCRAFRAAR